MGSTSGSFTVALVGADGAGKSTISRRLPSMLPFPTVTIYMGVSLESSDRMLPTTRAILAIKRARGRRAVMTASPHPGEGPAAPASLPRRGLASVKAGLRFLNWTAEECYRQIVVWSHLRRGEVVIFDRHFFADYYRHHVDPRLRRRTLTARLHGYLLGRVYPKPDLVICLDAPPEVLVSRKPETPLDFLRRRRQEYLDLRGVVERFVVIDAGRPLEQVERDVRSAILAFRIERGGAGRAA